MKMKERLSVTIDKELIMTIDEVLNDETFRNKSHLVEIALKKYLKEKKNDQ